MKPKPKWIETRESLKAVEEEPLVFIGEPGAAGVVDGLLPSGEPYTWFKRRTVKDTKFKGRRRS